MSTTTAGRGRRAAAPERRDENPGLNFLRAVYAEWLKLTSLRSSYVILIITLMGMVGIGLLSVFAVLAMADGLLDVGRQAGGPAPGPETLTEELGAQARGIPASGIAIAQFLIASLAVMQIGSEYGTRMISTTLTVVPRRLTAILAKTLVIAAVSFIVGAGAALISYAVAQPLLEPKGLDYAITADGVMPSILSTGAYLALIAILGLGIGTLLRNSAGGIMTTLGLLIVAPIVLAILSGQNELFMDISRFLPSSAGIEMVAIRTQPDALTQNQGGLVVAAWAAAALVGAMISVKRRDA
ncbi:putative ABC transporter transmembrane protein (plasmid) [Pseudarthrobacter chlorophenolicus A6]|uniref:ABC transporter transmembrane protein n=1 Tax=Pseudarthrobacter chlorophenolicus (strain ATCC 700700 / DSM 12829 / CIP 107037 / JCM 12360 / KCTC 9906 / NCIMB 13794 / A6) TaxID=452863 RepID=B8HHU0_PSECP|nr:ABC transporter permease [Pseudarthrobacter chlorophenolicus]ACL41987.1 putative ABC transporter transmembrane protein [Pseudarthrobacter chlorophenolicus A6]SDQ19920.1 ABC-2 family transporter protein [Pseudarthrobacter chlorophenolicus]